MTQKTLTKADLAQFTGSEQWYRHGLVRKVLYTDGAQYVDEIAFAQAEPTVAAEEFQLWKLKVNAGQTAILTCDDGNGNVVYIKRIEFTDLPLEEITLYFTNNVIMLPSEN